MKFQPIIKWSGSKRSQSEKIVSFFPKSIDTYYEPFVGGGSVLFQLLHSDIQVNKYACSDANPHLINLWNLIKEEHESLFLHYHSLWKELISLPSDYEGIEEKKKYFYQVRTRFNQHHDPKDFFFLLRTTTNGLVRFNQKGEFNNSFHVTRNGIDPERLYPILRQWSEKLREQNVQFYCQDYREIQSNHHDFLYLDPPYANTKGMYHGGIDLDLFWDWLQQQHGGYALSFDGTCGEEDMTYDVPESLFKHHFYLHGGVSPFRRIVKRDVQVVHDSLYLMSN